MLRWRLLSAAALIGVGLALLTLDWRFNFGCPGLWLLPAALVLALGAAAEALALARECLSAERQPRGPAVFVATALVVIGAHAPTSLAWLGLPTPLTPWECVAAAGALSLALFFAIEIALYQAPGGVLSRLATASFVPLYIGLAFAFLTLLRLHGDNNQGLAAVVSLLLTIKLSDTGAYLVGRLLGRAKLAPRLSPGKTIEGAVGGLAAAVLASWLSFAFVVPWMTGGRDSATSWWASGSFGLAIGLVGILGDLGESLLKREAGEKESSHWLPGLGGVLDVFDSVLLTAPVAYFAWKLGWVGSGQ